MSDRQHIGHYQLDSRSTVMGYYSTFPLSPHRQHQSQPMPPYPTTAVPPASGYVMAPASLVYPPLPPSHHQSGPPLHYVASQPTGSYSGMSSVESRVIQQRQRPLVDVDRVNVTYHGFIKTSTDAILLLAACDLPGDASAMASGVGSMNASASPPPRRIHRRLLESERADLIQPGSIFVWDEKEAGMRRWTDGKCWSASRVSGCFLTYRELEVRKRSAHDINGPRANQYKVEGLIKQSFSMTTASGRKLHIVSYYTKRDVREGRLRRVSEDPRFVGEAGGEWGLSVDEEEFPDPVVAGNEQAAAVAAQVGKSMEYEQQRRRKSSVSEGSSHPRRDARSTSPRITYHPSSVPETQKSPMLPSVQAGFQRSVYPSLPQPQDPARSSRGFTRPLSGQDKHAVAPIPRPPTLKRMRSSSAGDIVPVKRLAPAPTVIEPPPAAAESYPRRQSVSLLSLNLNESNARGAGRDSRPLPRPYQHRMSSAVSGSTPGTAATPPSEQDSAVGALLSLRSFSLAASSANNTPLTSPEDAAHTPSAADGDMPAAVAASKAMVPNAVGESQQLHRPAGPSRLNSDRHALSKFGTRI